MLIVLSGCVSGSSIRQNLISFSQLIPNFNQTTRIKDFVASKPQRLPQIRSNASGITWDPYQQQYFIIQNNSTMIYRYDERFSFLGKARASGNIHQDTEGLAAMGNNQFMLVSENNMAYQVEIDKSSRERVSYQAEAGYQLSLPPVIKNKGLEAVAFRPGSATRDSQIYAGYEGSGRYSDAKMRVVYFSPDLSPGFFASIKSFTDPSFSIIEPFDAEEKFAGVISDISGMTFDPTGSYLIIVSQESSKAIQVDPENGDIISQLSLAGAPAYEGVTIGPEGDLVFVSEKNWIQIFHHN